MSHHYGPPGQLEARQEAWLNPGAVKEYSRLEKATSAPTPKITTINDQVTALDPMLEAAHQFARRFSNVADQLFGAIPADANVQPGHELDNGSPLALRLERRHHELQQALNLMAATLERFESQL